MISATDQATCTVVVSRGQSRNPKKRELEQAITDFAAQLDGVDVIVVPHLYDLPKTSESYQKLSAIEGDMIVVSWIYSRAAHWVLDRNGIQGQFGDVQLGADESDAEEDEAEEEDTQTEASDPTVVVDRVAELYPRPQRMIHCLDLKISDQSDDYLAELRRIMGLEEEPPKSLPIVGGQLVQVEETTSRRWYPVIDFSRCTNCMECIDFCLFGVYGVDTIETILVEQPDNCRKGCPACSRVCPENAIIFPQHKSPAIAGAPVEAGGLKIDLSKLFGAPESDEDSISVAARERDEQLLLAGRAAVGLSVGIPKRQENKEDGPKDDLDNLLDELDAMDL